MHKIKTFDQMTRQELVEQKDRQEFASAIAFTLGEQWKLFSKSEVADQTCSMCRVGGMLPAELSVVVVDGKGVPSFHLQVKALFKELFPKRTAGETPTFVFPPPGVKPVCEDCREDMHRAMEKQGLIFVDDVREVTGSRVNFTWFNLQLTARIMGSTRAAEESELIEQCLEEIEAELAERERKVRLKAEAKQKRQKEIRDLQQETAEMKRQKTERVEAFLTELGIGVEDDGKPKNVRGEKRSTNAQKKRARKQKLNGSADSPTTSA